MREFVFDAGCRAAGRIGRQFGHDLRRPVFVIGSGRCGTSLFMQILRSHSGFAVFPGEANELWHPALEPVQARSLAVPPIEIDPAAFTQVSLAHWPPHHAARIRDIFGGFQLLRGASTVLVTKSAMVSFLVPTILDLFPEARILHLYRYGPSVVKSYVKKNFGKYPDLVMDKAEYNRACARYWNSCILEIAEQARGIPDNQFLEFSYEALCDRPAAILGDVSRFVDIAPSGYTFDLATLADQNFKASTDAIAPELLDIMAPALALKGYSRLRSPMPPS